MRYKRMLAGVFSLAISVIPLELHALTIKMGTLAPEGTNWIELAKKFSKHIEEFSNGQVRFVWYTGGVMGDEPDMIRKIKLGQLNGGGFTGMGLGIIVPEVRTLELPLLFDSYEEVDYVLQKTLPDFKERFRNHGLEFLGWAENGFVYAFSNVPIVTIEDLKKIKMWVWAGDSFAQEVFSSLGAISPIPMQVTGVLMGLQTGMINAFYNTLLGTVALQWYTQVKYLMDRPLTYSASALIISSRTWKKIPANIQAEIQEKGRELIDEMKKIARADNAKAKKAMLEAGITPVKPSDALINFFKKNVKKAYKNLEGKFYDKGFLEKIQFYINEYRSTHKATNKK